MALSIALFADIKGTQSMSANTTLNLDTGNLVTSGGDIQWSGTSMTPQGSAGVFNLGSVGSAAFGLLNQTALTAFPYSKSAIPASSLTANDVFAVKTNGGNYAAVLVTGVSGTTLALQFTTFGATSGSGGGGAPTISQVLNNYGLIPAGFSNSGIAPGSLFIIKGSGLADPAAQAVLQSSAGSGLPSTLNGASVKVTVNGQTTTPAFYYAIASQLALVMPSNTPVGTGQVVVTYNGQPSAPYTIQVVQSAMGFDAYYGTGSGLGVATNNATGALYNYTNSIPPGTTVVLWGSGLGADPPRDTTFVAAAASINGLSHVYVGGVEAAILYQGASGYPGVNQVDITIPTNAPTGCNVAVVGVNSSGVATNFVSLPIGTGPCSDSAFGVNGTTFQNLSTQATVKSGFVGLLHNVSPSTTGSGTQTTDLATASFTSLTGSAYGAGSGTVSVPGCTVQQSASGGSIVTATGLDAGSITVAGPNGTATLTTVPNFIGTYFAQLPNLFIPTSGGTFNYHGNGGANVGTFDTSIVFPNPLLNWTNQAAAATVTRSSGLPITWSGGAAGTFVFITGTSSGTVNGQNVSGTFTCISPVEATQFTVPNYVLSVIPSGKGTVMVSNETAFKTFSASGLDIGLAAGISSISVNSNFN